MREMDLDLLAAAYLEQLTRGCGVDNCSNEYCACNRNFRFREYSQQQIEELAITLSTERRRGGKLCPSLLYLTDPTILECCGAFNAILQKLESGAPLEGDSARILTTSFSHPKILGHLFAKNPLRVTQNDMDFDEPALNRFRNLLKSNALPPPLRQSLGEHLKTLTKRDITKFSSVRALLISLSLFSYISEDGVLGFALLDRFILLQQLWVRAVRKALLTYPALLPWIAESGKFIGIPLGVDIDAGIEGLTTASFFVSILSNINDNLPQPLPPSVFAWEFFDDVSSDASKAFWSGFRLRMPTVYHFPAFFSRQIKLAILRRELKKIRKGQPEAHIFLGDGEFWEELCEALTRHGLTYYMRSPVVRLQGRRRSDVATLSRMVGEYVTKPEFELVQENNGYYWFKYLPDPDARKGDIKALSSVFALACLNEVEVPVRLHPVVFKIMKGMSIQWYDLCALNPAIDAVLRPVMEEINSKREITRRVPFVLPGAVSEFGGPVLLKPDGESVWVGEDNVEEFVDLCMNLVVPLVIRQRFQKVYDEMLGTPFMSCMGWLEMADVYYPP